MASHSAESWPQFPQPQDATAQVWRYMDLPRLISLLSRHELILPRVDLMVDPFEGSIPPNLLKHADSGADADGPIARLRAHLRRGVYISSWHENRRESEAMWRLYCGSAEGVALSTTYAKLCAALETHPNTVIGRVTYIDYDSDSARCPNMQHSLAHPLAPFMTKRASFEHEREIRVLHWQALDGGVSSHASEPPPAVGLAWNIADAVEQVWVSPYAPRWYFDVVKEVLGHFAPDLVRCLAWSQMTADPWF